MYSMGEHDNVPATYRLAPFFILDFIIRSRYRLFNLKVSNFISEIRRDRHVQRGTDCWAWLRLTCSIVSSMSTVQTISSRELDIK